MLSSASEAILHYELCAIPSVTSFYYVLMIADIKDKQST